MKKIIFAVLLSMVSVAYAQDDEAFDTVRSGDFRYELMRVANSTVNSFSSGMNLQAAGYFFRVKSDSLHAEVPFVGSMINPAPGMDTNAIRIESKISGLKIREAGKGRKLLVSFSVYSGHSHEKFDILMTVTRSGSADVIFRSGKRDAITFIGNICGPDKE